MQQLLLNLENLLDNIARTNPTYEQRTWVRDALEAGGIAGVQELY
jgi:hypothetical protein